MTLRAWSRWPIRSVPRSRLSVVSVAASGRFPHFAHIGYMKVDEVAKGLEAGDGRSVRRQPRIDPGLRLAGPEMGVVAAKERLARVSQPFV